MPQHKSCIKRVKTSKKENLQNRAGKSTMRNVIKKVTASKTRAEALPLLRDAVSELDKLAAKNIIHRNKASNHKSALDTFYNKLPA